MLDGKTLLGVAVAFLVPLAVVAFMNRDTITEYTQPDPKVGKVLYFYSPG